MPCLNRLYIIIALIIVTIDSTAQQVVKDAADYKIIIAAPEYKKPRVHQWLWGRNHRKDWTTPVRVPVVQLDTLFGGLTPYKAGGGNETRALRLRTKNGKEYVMRSVRKDREAVIEPDFKNTFIEDLIKDGISMTHPYAALAVASMQQAAGIYYTQPRLVYVPQQKALDTFNTAFGNNLYLLEQKPSGDWSEARNLGNFKKFNETDETIERLKENNRATADQYLFIKCRLFDLLIADWDRHDGNWDWGEIEISGITWFVPVPHDRDQAFYRHNGKLIDRLLPAAGLDFMHNFDHKVGDVTEMSMESKNLDRFFSNAMSRSDWEFAAKSLQESLTDTVIANSLKQLPPEIFANIGRECIDILKSRRDQLPEFAKKYYEFLAKQVEVIGTRQKEYFDVNTLPNGDVVVAVFRYDKTGRREKTPYYQRTFKPGETKEVRLFGIDGTDVFDVENYSRKINLRVIGGPAYDSVFQKGNIIDVYDNGKNEFRTASADLHLRNDSAIHQWNYKWFKYNDRGLYPMLYYSSEDRLFVGIGYKIRKNAWRREPFAFEHNVLVNYSISQNALSATWTGVYPRVVGGWDLHLRAGWDAIRWQNFYGTGNEVKPITNDLNYYRLRSTEVFASTGLARSFGRSNVGVSVHYQRVQSLNDSGRFVSKVIYPEYPDVYQVNQYGTLQLNYSYAKVDDSILPSKGFSVLAYGNLARNFTILEWYQKYEAKIQAWIPLGKHFVFAMRVGGEHIVNDNVLNTGQFYMHAIAGGARQIRGYRRERFWGKTAFYNSNEIRWVTDLRTRLMSGKIGLVAFYDQGRVWMPGEKSNKMYSGYGPGLLLSPFNKITGIISYGMSSEFNLIQIRIERVL